MSVSGDRLRLPAVQPVRDAGTGQPGGTGERIPETGGLRTDAAAGACRLSGAQVPGGASPRHGKGAGGGRLLRPALLRPAGHGELGGHPAHDRTDGLHLRPGECGQGGIGEHALLPRRAATDDAGQGDEPPEGALPFLEPSGQAGNERAVREVRAGGRRHGAADAANPHPRHETLPQGGGQYGTDGVPLHAAGSRQADAGRQRHPRTDP